MGCEGFVGFCLVFVSSKSLFSGFYLFWIPAALFFSKLILALARVSQPWQQEQFWAMQSDCSSVSLKTCPCRSARCSCASVLVCQFMTTFLKLISWTSLLTVLWFVLWRHFGAQTGFLLDEINLRHVPGILLLLSSSWCTFSQRDEARTCPKSVSLLPSLSCNTYGMGVWPTALLHSLVPPLSCCSAS